MDVTATLDAPYPAAAVFAEVADLTSYPTWLSFVTRVEGAPPVPADVGPAWFVTLRARLGPLSRAKRLRMVRTTMQEPSLVVFDRAEADGRQHSPWVLRAELDGSSVGTALSMSLHYGGSLFDSVVERLLQREIEQAKPRLLARIALHV